jgi:hypothetical protein
LLKENSFFFSQTGLTMTVLRSNDRKKILETTSILKG